MFHSLYMWKSCSEPTPYGPHIGWRGVTSVQGGILADYDQIDTHVLKWNPAKFGYPKSLHIRSTRDWGIPSKLRFDAIYPSVAILVSRQFRAAYWLITTKTLVVDGTLLTQSFSFLKDGEIMYHSLYMCKSCSEPTPYGPHIGCHGVTSVQGGILADYNQIDTHVLKWNPAKFGYPKSLHIRATRDSDIPSNSFWCYISVSGNPVVTSVQGGILAEYDQNLSRGWDSPDTKFQLPQRLGNYVPLTLYVEVLFWANALRTPYWLTCCHVSSGRHIGWLRPNWYTCPEVKSCQVWLSQISSQSSYTWLRYSFQTPFWCYISVGGHPVVTSVQGGILADYHQNFSRWRDSPDTKFQLPQRPGNYVPLTLYVEILFWANALRTPYWLTWCHVSSGRHIGWLRPNWYTCPEVKSCQVWLS